MGHRTASQNAGFDFPAQPLMRRRKVYAWSASIFLHAVVFSAFWLFRFPADGWSKTSSVLPISGIRSVQKPLDRPITIPKPKVKSQMRDKAPSAKIVGSASLHYSAEKSNQADADSQANKGIVLGSGSFRSISPVEMPDLKSRVEFFGSSSARRKVCYVVDCSGSMKGMFQHVQHRLKRSIINLQADQYFHVIFFGADQLFELPGGALIRATDKNKSAACSFIDSIDPAGKTNALSAMERAISVRDIDGNAPSVIYFLTDGFDLGRGDSARFSSTVLDLVQRSAPDIQINTIGFWSQKEDIETLEAIAKQSKGQCVLINNDIDLVDSK